MRMQTTLGVAATPLDADDVHADWPPTVEGRIPTKEDMEFKSRMGRFYLDDVWVIQREFPTADQYDCATDLPGLANKMSAQVAHLGYDFVDVSDRMNSVKHALQLTMTWASIVREARTTSVVYIVRRTPQNSGAMLMMQRLEHLEGQCSEMAPLSYIVLARAEQRVVTRDRVTDQDTTERMILQLVKGPVAAFLEQEEENAEARAEVPNMPAALFAQQMHAVQSMLEQMRAGSEEAEGTEAEEDKDAVVVEVPVAPAVPHHTALVNEENDEKKDNAEEKDEENEFVNGRDRVGGHLNTQKCVLDGWCDENAFPL